MRSRSVKNQLEEIFESVLPGADPTHFDSSTEQRSGYEAPEKEREKDLPRSSSKSRDREEQHSHSRPGSLRIEIEEAPRNDREKKRENRRSKMTVESSPSQYTNEKLISTSPMTTSVGLPLPSESTTTEPKESEKKGDRARSPSKSRSSSRSESTSGEDKEEHEEGHEPGLLRSRSETTKNMTRIKGHRKVKSSGASHDIQNIISQTI
jgi:hypothetical protein